MTSNSLPSFSEDIRYGYLLFCKDGSILPLISIDSLPSIITVLPPLNAANELTLVQEITSPSFSGLPFLDACFLAGKAKDTGTTKEETVRSSVPQRRPTAYSFYPSSCSSSSSASSVVGRFHNAFSTRTLFPDVFSLPLEDPAGSTFASSSPKDGLFYVPPHSKEATTPASAVEAHLPAPTRESFLRASGSSKPCPTHFSSERCPWGATCIFHHGSLVSENCRSPVLESENEGDDDASSEEENHAITVDKAYSTLRGNSLGNRNESSIENNADAKRKEKGKKLKSIEFCTYFHRSVGCKRGKDCFYTHEKDGSTKLVGKKFDPIKKSILTANSSKKLEGKWRRNEPQYLSAAKSRGKEVAGEVITDRKVNVSKITCLTPGRTLSATDPIKHIKTHCTFFLRFGECDYWPACKFSHEAPDGARKWRGSKLPSKPRKSVSSSSDAKKTDMEYGSKIDELTDPLGIPGEDPQYPLEVADDSGFNSEISSIGAAPEERTTQGIAEGQLISLAD